MFDIKLSLEQVNVVLLALSKLPYETSAPVIESVRRQAEEQMMAQQAMQSSEPEVVDASSN